jgi:sec-independent protein translocase protein TatC
MSLTRSNEDLFEDTKMSFGEHLEELRSALVKSLIGVAIGFMIGLAISHHIVAALQSPLNAALERFKIEQVRAKILKETGGYVPPKIVQAMKDLDMIPKKIFVSEEQLADLVHSVLGNSKPNSDELSARFLPNQLKPSQAQPLAKRFVKAETSTPEGYLFSLLSAEEQVQIEAISESNSRASEADRDLILSMLNRLLDDESILDAKPFSDLRKIVYPKDEIDAPLAANDEWEQLHRRRLNEALLLEGLRPEISVPALNLVELSAWEPVASRPQSISAEEPFMIWMKTGLLTGLVFASPWVFYQIWMFVAAGMYPHEKKYVYIYIPFSLGLFVIGATFAFYVVFGYVLDFLFTFNASMGIDPDPRIGSYLGFVTLLPLGFGVAFQLPLVMLLLHRIGLFSIETYLNKWRISVLVIFLVSMILTPSDPISMLLMALPLTFLYFFGILLCRWMPRNRSPFKAAYDPA